VKTATVRQLRTQFPKIEGWLAGGERVAITKRKIVVAELIPPQRPKPDFRRRFGGKIVQHKVAKRGAVDLLIEERGP